MKCFGEENMECLICIKKINKIWYVEQWMNENIRNTKNKDKGDSEVIITVKKVNGKNNPKPNIIIIYSLELFLSCCTVY